MRNGDLQPTRPHRARSMAECMRGCAQVAALTTTVLLGCLPLRLLISTLQAAKRPNSIT
jgi:hypothetical protein